MFVVDLYSLLGVDLEESQRELAPDPSYSIAIPPTSENLESLDIY